MLVTYRRRKPNDGGPPAIYARWEYGFQGTWRKEKRTFKSVQSMRGWFREHFCGYWDVKFRELIKVEEKIKK